MAMRILSAILFMAIAVGVIYGFKFWRKADTGAEALTAYREVIGYADCYTGNKEYLDHLLETAHEQVFSESYQMDFSKRDTRSRLNEDVYSQKLFDHMIQTARNDNATHIAECLERLRKDASEAP